LRGIVRRLESLVPLVASGSTGKLVWHQNDCNATDKRCSVYSFLLPMIVRHTHDTVNSTLRGVDKAGQQSEMLSTPSLSDLTLPAVVIYTLPTPTFNPRVVAFPFIITFPHLQLVCSISIFSPWPNPSIKTKFLTAMKAALFVGVIALAFVVSAAPAACPADIRANTTSTGACFITPLD